jgi:3-deoxy-D-manno-octulosonic-acid transferase
MWWRTKQRSPAPNWNERVGQYSVPRPTKERPRVWLHAVSVGEVMAARPILRAIRERSPEAEIVLSVTTSSGYQAAKDGPKELFDYVIYAPIDVPRFVLNAMARVRPQVLAIMETELWMNWLWVARQWRVPTLLVNGRISDRSFPRSMRIRPFYAALLKFLDRPLMQTATDAERITQMGATNAQVFGNCKFDEAAAGESNPEKWREELRLNPERPVVVIGSTRGEEEEAFVAEALADPRLADVQVVWAPRHLERADAIAERLQGQGVAVGRRSQGTYERITLLDTYGELGDVYAVADVAVIGGGFANLGGQNLIQALAKGAPVLHGPHMQNFRDVAEMAKREEASVVAVTPAELAQTLADLLADPARRQTMSTQARALVQQNLGASARYAEAIAEALAQAQTKTAPR